MAEPTPIELKLENGNVIKAENAEEALKVAAKMIEDNSKAYRETKGKLEAMEGQFQTVQQQLDALKPKEAPTSGFQKDRYYQLLNEDPLKAQNYLDGARFGVDPELVPEYFTNLSRKVESLDGNTLAATFVNTHQDFPQDETAAQALTQRVAQLKAEGFPVTARTMDLAYSELLREGKIKPIEEPEPEELLPPSPGGAGNQISASEMQKVEAMTDKELQAYLKSKGML